MSTSKVFFSSSADLADIRKSFDVMYRTWKNGRGQSQQFDVEPFLWEKDEVLEGLDAREPVQGQLPRTDSEEVVLTVGMFGERCGVPLAAESELGRYFTCWTKGRFRLLHPWPISTDAEKKALSDGCFPLTGTIFEQLCAIDAVTPGSGRSLPFIGYVANCHVSTDSELEGVAFNNTQLLDRTLTGKTGKQRAELEPPLMHQRWGMLNYLKALIDSGKITPIHYTSAEAMRDGLLEHTKKEIIRLTKLLDGTPGYRDGLTFYDIHDTYELPGLQSEADSVANEFWREAFDEGACPETRTLLLTGPSGCGKSSFMRRGILGSLVRRKKQAAITVAFRPNDLDPHGDTNCLSLLWQLILGADPRITTNLVMDPTQPEAADAAARALTDALTDIDARLLLGVDQFEEFLDLLFRQAGLRREQSRLWPVFAFLRGCLEGGRVAIVATLEDQRDTLREDFAKAEFGWRIDRTEPLELNEKRVRKIIDGPLRAAGLPPTADAVSDIVKLWKALDGGMSDKKASTLPLLGLWLARLQDKYRELAKMKGETLTEEFQDVLNSDRVKDMKPMESLIDELATTAWLDVADTYGAVEVKEGRRVPKLADLNGVLQPFVGLSKGGQKVLRNVTKPRFQTLQSAVIERFLKLRLMVPVVSDHQDQVRLTHQAVIDRWNAAAQWIRDFETYLNDERVLLEQAYAWKRTGRPELRRASKADITRAASALDMLRATVGHALSEDNRLLVDYALELFRHSRTPLAKVAHSLDGNMHVHVAAAYDLGNLLLSWLGKAGTRAKSIANKPNSVGATPLRLAAWSSPAAVATLLRFDVQVKKADRRLFHPICGSVQSGRKEILDLLIGHYQIDEPVCGHDDRTLLHQAALSGQLEVLLDLIKRGASPDICDSNGQTPLMYAAINGHLAIVAELRSRKSVLVKDNWVGGGWRAIDYAAREGKWKVIDLILKTPGLTKNDRIALLGPTVEGQLGPLGLAAGSLRPGTVKWFLSRKDVDPSDARHFGTDFGNLAEMVAVVADRDTPGYHQRLRDTLQVLLDDKRIDPNVLGWYDESLHQLVAHSPQAARLVNGHPRCPRDWENLTAESVKTFIDLKHEDEALRFARKRPDLLLHADVLPRVPRRAWPEVAPILAEKVNLQDEGCPLLIEAIHKLYPFTGNAAVAEDAANRLIDRFIDRIDLETPASTGGILLALVAGNGTPRQVEILLDKGAPTDQPLGPVGSLPLHFAAHRQDKVIFELILRKMSGQPAPRDAWGRLPSQVAPRRDRAWIAALEAKHFKVGV